MIVTAKPPKPLPPRKPPRAPSAQHPPQIVVKPQKRERVLPDDPEADARVRAFIRRVLRLR